MVGLSDRKFLLRNEDPMGWKNFDDNSISSWFSKIRDFGETDILIPRTVWLECKGLPMTVWLEENMKAYTRSMGEWLSWTYQRDDSNDFFNPLVCLSTTRIDKIEECFQVLVKGKKYPVKFSEIVDRNLFRGKILPMQDEPLSWNYKEGKSLVVDRESDELLEQEIINEKVDKVVVSQKGNPSPNSSGFSASVIPESHLEEAKVDCNLRTNSSQDKNLNQVINPNGLMVRDFSGSTVSMSDLDQINNSIGNEDSLTENSSVIVGEDKVSSQGTLCQNLGNLKMKGAAGRPRKKTRTSKNPFDLGLSKKKLRKFKLSKKQINSVKVPEMQLFPVKENAFEDHLKEAELIMKCANDLGLQIQGEGVEAVKLIASQLEEGVL